MDPAGYHAQRRVEVEADADVEMPAADRGVDQVEVLDGVDHERDALREHGVLGEPPQPERVHGRVAEEHVVDVDHPPAWLRIGVAGWPAIAFLGGTLLVHTPAADSAPEPTEEPAPVDVQRAEPAPVLDEHPEPVEPAELPAAEPTPTAAPVPKPDPVSVPPALLDHARKLADKHHQTTGTPLPAASLRAQLGLPAPVVDSIAAQLQLT